MGREARRAGASEYGDNDSERRKLPWTISASAPLCWTLGAGFSRSARSCTDAIASPTELPMYTLSCPERIIDIMTVILPLSWRLSKASIGEIGKTSRVVPIAMLCGQRASARWRSGNAAPILIAESTLYSGNTIHERSHIKRYVFYRQHNHIRTIGQVLETNQITRTRQVCIRTRRLRTRNIGLRSTQYESCIATIRSQVTA